MPTAGSMASLLSMSIDSTLVPVITAAIGPVLGFVSVLLRAFLADRSYRTIKKLTEIHENLPEAAKAESESLIKDLVTEYSNKARRKLHRRVDGASIAALVFVAVAGFVVTYLLVLGGNAVDGIVGILIYVLAAAAALFAFLLMLVGVGQLFVYPGDEKYEKKS